MYEVVKRDKSLADKIIQDNSDMMFAGVVTGSNSGRVWVDNLEGPVSALVWSEGLQCFQFMGRAASQAFNNELRSFIDDTIIGFLKEKKLDYFEYASDVEEWYPIIYNTLSDRKIKESWQRVYRSALNPLHEVEAVLPKPYRLHQIDRSFISSVRIDNAVGNPEFLVDYIQQFWGSVENYLNLGYGCAAVDEEKIVSFVVASALYNETFSIGVETLEQHRRKGLAGTLARALFKSLHDKGYNIWWDCMESNTASQKTAESAGLVLDHKYKVCWFNF